MALIAQQLRYGPRYLGAEGHRKVIDFIRAEMEARVDAVVEQAWRHTDAQGVVHELTNLIGRVKPAQASRIILATHFDSKRLADKDRHNPAGAVPGANDSASGVAVLIEMARVMAKSPKQPAVGIDFVFFDGEEGEPSQGSDYTQWTPLGSSYFAQTLDQLYPDGKPQAGIVIDMVCDKDLRLYKEAASVKNAPQVVADVWRIGQITAAAVFRDKIAFEVRDDHTPLNNAGIPSIILIDPVYEPFHTTRDTLNQCSPRSLETVAATLLEYVYSVQ